MNPYPNTLTLIVTGLFPRQNKQLRLPALERLLSVSRALNPASPVYEWLDTLPLAPLYGLAEGIACHTDWWIRADPIHMKAGLNHMQNLGNQHINLSLSDTLNIVNEINLFLKPDGLELLVTDPKHWYLKCSSDPQVITQNKPIMPGIIQEEMLPQGQHATYWRTWINHMQMWLSQHPLAQRLQINSLWLWGSGCLFKQIAFDENNVGNDGIYGDSLLVQGLAQWCGTSYKPLATLWDDLRQVEPKQQHYLGIIDNVRFVEPNLWSEAVSYLDEACFAHIIHALKNSYLQRVDLLLSEQQQYTVTKKDVRRWWIRKKPFFLRSPHA